MVIKEDKLGTDHVSTLNAYYGLGNLHRSQGNTVEARELFTKCVEGYEATMGRDYEWARNAQQVLETL